MYGTVTPSVPWSRRASHAASLLVETEQRAIEYAERFVLDHHTMDDAFFARLRSSGFSDAEILDLTVCVGGWLALGRTLHVLGIDDSCRLPE